MSESLDPFLPEKSFILYTHTDTHTPFLRLRLTFGSQLIDQLLQKAVLISSFRLASPPQIACHNCVGNSAVYPSAPYLPDPVWLALKPLDPWWLRCLVHRSGHHLFNDLIQKFVKFLNQNHHQWINDARRYLFILFWLRKLFQRKLSDNANLWGSKGPVPRSIQALAGDQLSVGIVEMITTFILLAGEVPVSLRSSVSVIPG